MKILVPLSIVPDIYCSIEKYIEQDTVCVDDTMMDINPLDTQILSCAMTMIPEQLTVVHVGDSPRLKSLRYASAMGVKDIRRIDAPCEDAFTVAVHLASFLEKEKYDVIMCGEASWDYSTGNTPQYLSQTTGIPLIKDVAQVVVSGEKTLTVTRQTEQYTDTLNVVTPVILMCTKAIFPLQDVRIPSMREMMVSTKAAIDVITATEKTEPKTHYSQYRPMPSRPAVKMLTMAELPFLADLINGKIEHRHSHINADEVSLFSGRIIAKKTAENAPCPVFYPDEGEKTFLPAHKDLRTAKIILSGGMGCDKRAWEKIEFLSQIIPAAIACTRPVYHSGVRSYYEHVGQTGIKVSPDIYLALGISGALQHIGGMVRSGCVIAVNTAAAAPIFHYADYGIVGDVNEVLDGLVEILTKK